MKKNTFPVRVLQIVGRMDRGGIENFIMNIYRNIDRERVQFDFLAHYGREAAFNEEIRSMGGIIYEMPAIRNETNVYYWKIFDYIYSLNRFFKNHREYRVIHGQMINTAAIYMPIAKWYGVTTLIAHSHTSHGKEGLLGIATNVLKKPVFMLSTDLFACSKNAASFLFPESYVRKEIVKIIPNAIDISKFRFNPVVRDRIRKQFNIDKKIVIGCVGRFRLEKNQSFLLDVFAELLISNNNKYILMFIGDGPLEENVKMKAKILGIQNKIIFLGNRDDVHCLMQAMDVLVMPSLFEGLPVTGIEAQASGLHIIASREVTEEMNILNMVEYLSLDAPKKDWAERISLNAQKERFDTYDKMKIAGYDINTIVPWLENFYITRSLTNEG